MFKSIRSFCFLLGAILGIDLFVHGGAPAAGGIPAEDKKQITRPTAAVADIERFIEQVGSKNFQEREAASRALDVIGYPALAALRAAARQNKDPETRRRAADLVQRIENRLDALYADYRAFGLPLPPASARLVRYPSGGGIVNGKKVAQSYSLAFQVKRGVGKERPTILLDTMQFQPSWDIEVIELERKSAKEIEKLQHGEAYSSGGLAFAIQCKALGWDALAQAAFNKCYDAADRKAEPRADLIRIAWAYWYLQLGEPDTDWKLIATRLKEFLAADKSLDEPRNRALLRSLDAALVPSKARPGSVAALIDDLINCRSVDIGLGEGNSDPRYLRLALRSFDAVPELIEHLDDDRLTRTHVLGFNNFQGYDCRVGHLVSDLLQGLADEELGRDWLRRLQGYKVKKEVARSWWEKARQVGEESYVVKRILRAPAMGEPRESRVRHFEASWPNAQLLWIVVEKYPHQIPNLYRTILDQRPEFPDEPLARMIPRSKLPRKEKVELLVHGAAQKNLSTRAASLRQLHTLDEKAFVRALIETLDHLPASPTGACWECAEASFAPLVLATEDPQTWHAFLKAAKRAEVGLRMEYLGQAAATEGTPRQRLRRAKFLAEFLDDASVREGKGHLYEMGEAADVGIREIEVRNFAAIAIGRLLKLTRSLPGDNGIFAASTWNSEQWAKLRNEAREALRRQPQSPEK